MERVRLYGINPKITISKKVAIVGNSDNLLEKEYGREIDMFDDVIRFNFADTNLHPKNTGTKTTIRWVSCPIRLAFAFEHKKDVRSQLAFHKYSREIFKDIVVIARKGSHKQIRAFDKNIRCFGPNEYYSIEETNKYLTKLGVKTKLKIIKNSKPRTGLIAILTAIHSGCKPHIYGFDLVKKEYIRHYSLNRKYVVKDLKIHQINTEVAILKELEKKKLIIIKR